jgi:hypothetical protein
VWLQNKTLEEKKKVEDDIIVKINFKNSLKMGGSSSTLKTKAQITENCKCE